MLDKNITVVSRVAGSIDNGLSGFSQDILIELYKKVPYLGKSFFSLTYGQILMAIAIFLFIIFIRPLLVKLIIKFGLKLAKKSKTKYDDLIIFNLKKPLGFSFLILALYSFVSILYITSSTVYLSLGSLVIYNFFWFLWSVLGSLEGVIFKAASQLSKDISKELSQFLLRVLKTVIVVTGLSSVLSLWGINVTALIASLGLGGLAFALAAKDTAANLFGSIAILLDKSIKEGDWIIVNGVEGIVEDIGMRTTKIRSFESSLIIVPNQIVASSNIENFSRRNIRRVKMKIGLTYDTTNTQIESIIDDIKVMLKNHSGISQRDTMLVNFDNLSQSAKEILVYTFTNTANWQEYLNIKEDIQYKITNIVAKNGSSFAFPTQSIYIENLTQKAQIKQK